MPDNSHIFKQQDRSFFGFRLTEVVSLPALNLDPSSYIERYRSSQVGLLRWLMNPGDEAFTYDLRLVARPDPETPSRGEVDVMLLCGVTGLSTGEVERYAATCGHRLSVDFDEYSFDLMPADQVETALTPFEISSIVAIRRRAGNERLDTLRASDRKRKRIGLIHTQELEDEPAVDPSIVHMFPFRPVYGPMDRLFGLLLRQPEPTTVSVRLRPTTLDKGEKTFLADQIDKSERYASVSVGSVTDVDALRPTLRDQAKIYQQFHHLMLQGLNDDAALVTIEIASSTGLTDPLVDAVGQLVTHPAGWSGDPGEAGLFAHLAGGYDVVPMDDEAASNLSRLELTLSDHPSVPEDAGRLLHMFDAVEAAAAFRLPPATTRPQPGVTSRDWRSNPPPREMSQDGALVGVAEERGTRRRIYLSDHDRSHHVYVVGRTGTGKTTLLKSMILSDIEAGEGVCLIDPHGDLFDELLGRIPKERLEDVIIVDPSDIEHPVGINILEYDTPEQRYQLVGEVQAIAYKMMQDEYGLAAAQQMVGPVFMQHVARGVMLATSDPDDPGTLPEFYTIFTDKDYWRRWVPLKTSDPVLERWVKQELPNRDYTRVSSDGDSMGVYIGSKFSDLATNPVMRNMLGQKTSTIDFREVMDTGKILLINLGSTSAASGGLSPRQGRVLGMLILARIYLATKQRPQGNRRPFHVYVDEFQNLATRTFADMLAEVRKFGVSLVLANQFISQVDDPRIMDAVLGNVGSLFSFRVGIKDAEILEREFYPFTRYDLVNLPNWRAYVRTQVAGALAPPFDIETVVQERKKGTAPRRSVLASSRRRYGRKRAQVEKEIIAALAPVDRDRGTSSRLD